MTARALLLAASGLLAATPAAAWSPPTQVAIATAAAELAPPDLARQIDKDLRAFREGAVAPFRGTAAEDHVQNPDGSGGLLQQIDRTAAAAVEAIRSHRPFRDVVHLLGQLAHWVADANNPLNASAQDPEEARYFADYLRYVDSARPRFTVVLYAGQPQVASPRDLRVLAAQALRRGRDLYPLTGAEYRRIGFGSGVAAFDDRSTAFGIAAVSYSHAVSDVARALRYVWLEAGGMDPRDELWEGDRRLLVLPRPPRAR